MKSILSVLIGVLLVVFLSVFMAACGSGGGGGGGGVQTLCEQCANLGWYYSIQGDTCCYPESIGGGLGPYFCTYGQPGFVGVCLSWENVSQYCSSYENTLYTQCR